MTIEIEDDDQITSTQKQQNPFVFSELKEMDNEESTEENQNSPNSSAKKEEVMDTLENLDEPANSQI